MPLYIHLRILRRSDCAIIFKLFMSVVLILDFCKYTRPFEKQISERIPC